MKPALTRTTSTYWHYDDDGNRVYGAPSGIRGNLSGVYGDLSGIRGDLSGVIGNLSGIRGDLSGIWGNLSGIVGDLDECEITDADRANGIDIDDLIIASDTQE